MGVASDRRWRRSSLTGDAWKAARAQYPTQAAAARDVRREYRSRGWTDRLVGPNYPTGHRPIELRCRRCGRVVDLLILGTDLWSSGAGWALAGLDGLDAGTWTKITYRCTERCKQEWTLRFETLAEMLAVAERRGERSIEL